MHGKEQVIAPVLEEMLGVNCFTSGGLNTDQFGTFSGEVVRQKTPYATALDKCRLAMELTGCDLAVASEGSFGPHPVAGFISVDEELLVFHDRLRQLTVAVTESSVNTNFGSCDCATFQEAIDFAKAAGFPAHGLVVKTRHGRTVDKGIVQLQNLKQAFDTAWVAGLPVKIETDMRACYNPRRMQVIAKAAVKLAAALISNCPACAWPGFVVTDAERGLPCSQCGLPTRSVSKHVLVCKKCAHRVERPFPAGKQAEDPMHCDFCNP